MMNIDQAKHLASSARVIGMAQFGHYGYAQIKAATMDYRVFGSSLLMYLASEAVAWYLLGKAKGK